jgi:hypothetical protein
MSENITPDQQGSGESVIGKGRPTPKRKDAQAAQRHSSFAPARTKEEKAAARALDRSKRTGAREAFMRGEESALPARDKGPVKRFVRDFVDSKFTIGEYFMPIIVVVLVMTIIPNRNVQLTAVATMYFVMLFTIGSGFILGHQIKKACAIKFPGEKIKGAGIYGFMRSSQMRRMRAPSPQVKRGDKVA